ncbi:MAG TPA: hypothetical protein VI855_02080 [Dehalococcoidia bacterium]|nr:hypothetical protein [Dehalococcoidia bacterium]
MILPGPQTSQHLLEAIGSLRYNINFDRLEELKRSATFQLSSRLDPEAESTYGPDQVNTTPEALAEEIADRYGDENEFIQAELPIQEIIFRILLMRRNEPISLQELQQALNDRWATPVRPINITQGGLKRILDADTFYGFALVPSEE